MMYKLQYVAYVHVEYMYWVYHVHYSPADTLVGKTLA